MVRTEPRLRQRLERNIQRIKSALREQGFPVPGAPSPIIPFHPSTTAEGGALRERLLARQIYPCFIEYPGGPEERLLSLRHFQRAQRRAIGRSVKGPDDGLKLCVRGRRWRRPTKTVEISSCTPHGAAFRGGGFSS